MAGRRFEVADVVEVLQHWQAGQSVRHLARSLGVGFWGLLVGGGPWGQPCHLAHHMVASIPWYQQIILHRYIVGLLTETQRKQFLLKPIVGFPALLWGILRESNRFSRACAARVLPGD